MRPVERQYIVNLGRPRNVNALRSEGHFNLIFEKRLIVKNKREALFLASRCLYSYRVSYAALVTPFGSLPSSVFAPPLL